MKIIRVFLALSVFFGLFGGVGFRAQDPAEPENPDLFTCANQADPMKRLTVGVIGTEAGYSVTFRTAESGRLLGSFPADIDAGNAFRNTRAFWSSDGRYCAVETQHGRVSWSCRVYFIEREALRVEEIRVPDYIQNILGRLKALEGPDNLAVFVVELRENRLKLSVSGSGSIDFPSHEVVIELFGDRHVVPYARIASIRNTEKT